MVRDFRQLDAEQVLQADLCIVGAGPVGISLAAEIAGRSNKSVLLLEAEGRQSRQTEAGIRSRSVGLPYSIEETRRRGIGGTSSAWDRDWGARMGPFEAIDFTERGWISDSGWPFGPETLQRYYDRASEILELPTATKQAGKHESCSAPGLELDPERLRNVPIYFVPKRHFSEERVIALPERVQIWYHAEVIDLRMDAGGTRVVEARIRRFPTGSVSVVKAETFVLAGGAVSNAHLLLASDSGRGVGNQFGLVGRYFMEHAKGECGLFVPRSAQVVERLAPYSLHQREGFNARLHLFLAEQAIHAERLLGMYAALWPTEPDWLSDDLRDLAMRIRRAHGPEWPLYAISFQIEQAPLPENRLSLERDRAGDVTVVLNWKLTSLEYKTLVRGTQIIQEEFLLNGAGAVFTKPYLDESGGYEWNLWRGEPYRIKTSHHPTGTTRMHPDPRKGVVDTDCKVHGISNLFVSGSSTFPTGSHMNPTFTAVAMAVRLARHLIDSRT